jgi:3-hydroxyacyl-CoA dehydrogenase/enoyl-CoA hydratase/3-hydroxybutyryl-CoA epimerase
MMDFKKISFEIKNDVVYIGFGYNCEKSMTVLDEQTMTEFKQALEQVRAQQKNYQGLILHTHKDNCFLAGADINLISSMQSEEDGARGAAAGQEIYNTLEDLLIPTVACVNGVCLGGGTEMILACDTVIASDNTKTQFGLPEVKLGLIPGFGGTYRMPKKVGLPNSLDLILSGKTLNAKRAKKYGLIEEYFAKERLLTVATRYLKKSHSKKSFKESLGDMAQDNFVARKVIFQKARENVLKLTKGFYQAPLKILDVMEKGQGKSRSSYLTMESNAFGELCVSEQSKNLQHIFFMMEGSKKYSGPKSEKEVKTLTRGACLGAGTMGGGIAWLMANNNMMPIMKDLNLEALELGLKQSSENFRAMLKRKKISKDDFNKRQRSITTQLDYRGFQRVDLVVEAVVENMDIKKSVFKELENVVSKDCILTSNTSSLSVSEMASVLETSERFAGLHFFNPVNKMPLVEIITHDKVAPETVESLYNWVLKTKKTPVIVKDGPGFLVNRILMPYLNEAAYLLKEGVAIEDVDEACLNFGMPMGPCRLMDEVGIDVAVKVAKIMHEGLGERAKSNDLSKELESAGLLGKKNGKGFYLYDEKGKHTEVNPQMKKFLPNLSKKMDEIEIQLRLFLPMINEAAMILDEKIVDRPVDVDLGLIFGIGFPPFRGGLLRYADSEGLDNIVHKMNKYAEDVNSDRYAVAPLLKKLLDNKQKFYELE